MKAYSYIRFSTPEQAQGDSLRRQTAATKEWLKANPSYELDTELNMRDLGTSAWRSKNLKGKTALGGFQAAIDEGGLIPDGSVLLIERLDRLSRDYMLDAMNTLAGIVRGGVDVVNLSTGKRYTIETFKSDIGAMITMAVEFATANQESEKKSDRLLKTWAAKLPGMSAKKKVIASARVPAWLDVEGSAAKGGVVKLSLNTERVRVLKRIFKEFNAGLGTGSIAYNLNQDKVPAFGGTFWVQKTIYKYLRWRAVLGEFTPVRAGIPQAPISDYFPRAIDDDTFEAAQALAESKAGRMPSREGGLIMNVLTKLGVCPKCGASMRRKQGGKKRNSPSQPKLVCSKADHGVSCDHVTVDLGEIETALVNWDCKVPRKDGKLEQTIKSLETEHGALGFDIHELVNLIIKRPSAALSKRLAEYEAKLERIAAELAALKKQAGESDGRVLKRRAEQLKEALSAKSLDRAAVNVALRTLLSKVVVEYDTAELVLHWKHDGVTRLDINDRKIAAKEFRI